MQRMEERRRARRQLLLEAAVSLFASGGYHATTVPAIVRKASSSIGSFYAHFRSKEEILLAILEDLDRRVAERVAASGGEGQAPLVQVARSIAACLQFLLAERDYARILLVEAVGLNVTVEARRREIIERQEREIERALEAAVRQGSISRIHCGVAARGCVGSVLEVVSHWLVTGEPEDTAAMADTLIEFNLRGISRAPARSR